jgi:Carboxypeptidase regulatory-like domain
MRTSMSRFLVLICALFILTPAAFAQFSQRGSVSGVVTEPSGAVVANAPVSLLDLNRNQTATTTTDATGHYSFSQLLPGDYQVTVDFTGFTKSVSAKLSVSPQADVRCDVQLQVASVSSTVTVTGSSAPLLDTETANVDQNVTQQQLETVPMNGRNWTSLTELTPAVSVSPRNNINMGSGGTYEVGSAYTSGGADYTAGGNAEGSRDNGYYVNGVNANDNYEGGSSFSPSSEAIAEVKIGVADFSAQYGRDFTNLSATTKSGTNTFHGEAYEYFENDALNALVPINKAQGLTGKDAYRYNLFGGNIGGPVYIPKLLNLKDKAFFFANYERNPRSDKGPNNLGIVPNDAQRAGDFGSNCTGPINAGTFSGAGICSNPAGQLFNPYTGNAIPFNNLVTAGLFNPANASPQVAALINLFPHANITPTLANSGADYQYGSQRAISLYHWDSRFDYRISAKDSVFVAWSQYSAIPNNSGGFVPNLDQATADTTDKSYVVSVDEAHVFAPNLTNEFIFAVGAGSYTTLPPSALSFLNGSSNPFNSIFNNTGTAPGGNTGVLGLNIYNYGQLFSQPTAGFDEYFTASNTSWQASDNLTWVHGSHTMTFGFNFLRKGESDFDNVRYVSFGCAYAPGSYCGNGPQLFTANNGVGGDAFAEVELGLPSAIHQRADITSGGPFAPRPQAVIPYYGAYFNDSWKATQTITVGFGLRYDLPIPVYGTNDGCCALYESSTDTLAIPGIAPGIPQHYAPIPKHDFAPRLSVAWQARPSLVVRAGYGLYYVAGASQISNVLSGAFYGGVPGGFVGSDIVNTDPTQASLSQVFQASPQVAPGTFPVATGTGQGYYGDGALQTVFYADKKSFKTPYVHRYTLDIQKQIARNSVISATYIGAEGRDGWYFVDQNAAPYQTGWASSDDYNAARPFNSGRFGDIYLQRAGLNSNYNAGVVKFQHQMTNGLQILAHYTFSKDMGQRGIVGQGTQDTGYNYPQSVIRSYGPETYSHPNRFVFQATYAPKYQDKLPAYARPFLGDWHVSALATFESGDSLTVYNGTGNQANDFAPYNGLGNLDVVGNPNFSHGNRSFNEYFNTAAFVVPPNNVQGTADPGIVRGPGTNNWDLSFGKTFNIYERFHAEFRADMYNAFNHTQWNAISTQLNGSTGPFGQVTGSREGRIVEFGAKVAF